MADNIHGLKTIYTEVTFSIKDRLRGSIDINVPYSLRVIGGVYDGNVLKAEGMPEFKSGENVMVFLRNYNGRMSVVFGEFGKVTIEQ